MSTFRVRERGEPILIVTLVYSRLGKVSMASLVDDEVNLNEFRKQLGRFELVLTRQDGQATNGARNGKSQLLSVVEPVEH